MPFDAIFLTALADELRQTLADARVEKITQPARDTVIVQLRTHDGHRRLLLGANPNHARVQLTELSFENPTTPPMFCMLLRKHLSGGRLTAITQPPMERALAFHFACTDEMGVACEKQLVAELMGGASNILLLDGEQRILDCLRRVDMSASRPVLPGLFYHPPLRQERLDPTAVSAEEIAALLPHTSKRLDKWILEQFSGISPLIAREICYALTGETDTDILTCDGSLSQALFAQFQALPQPSAFQPTMLLHEGVPKDFSFRPIAQYGSYMQMQPYPDCSALLDAFYGARDKAEKMRQKSQVLNKTVTNLYERVTRKLANQRLELAATLNRERTRQLGDIVTANLYRMQRGQTLLRATDFYDPEMGEIEIPLSPTLSPQQNAAKFYKDYNKAKTAQRVLTEQIAKGEQEQDYLGSVLDALSRAESGKDLSDIRAELLDGGYIRERSKGKRMKTPPSRPMEFVSSDGFPILVGRNNRQNDQLTTKMAEKRDIWLHVQKIHGSHTVILCGGVQPPDQTVTEAMQLAAYYSQAREGTLVPVDYCPVKHVKKPAGAKPGMVIYETYRTGYVTPDPKLPEKLQKQG